MRRPGPPRAIPPPLELECLKALWTIGEGSVRDVREEIGRSRNLAYTTVMTVLSRLNRRGAVVRKKSGRMFVYTPAVTRESMLRAAVGDLVDSFFGGSEEALRAYLQANPRPRAEDDPDPA